MKAKLISFHPKLAAILDGLFSVAMIWWIAKIGTPTMLLVWFIFRAGWWVALVECMYYPPSISRLKHWVALIIFNLGLTSFLVFIDWQVAWYLAAAIFVLAPLFSFWLVPAREDELSVLAKPQRRARFLMSVIGLAGIWSGVAAMITFQIISQSSTLLLISSAAVVTALVSVWWWAEYGSELNKNLLYSALVILLVIFELSYVVALWPVGYLVAGFFITWVWYDLWILLRFSFSKEGIDWRRQKTFLLINVILAIIFLSLIVRWR